MKKWLPEELEEIPCDFCGGRDVAGEFKRADGMRVVECATCGLAFLNPRPKPEFISRFYEADYFTGAAADRGEGGLRCSLDPSSALTADNQGAVPRPIAIVNEKFGGWEGKDVLEIGCATGDLLLKLQREGAMVKGLEISDFAAAVARKRGLDVTAGTIEAFAPENEAKFDVVLALEVIEHVLSPTRFIANVARVLKPGGLLVLSTPNYACTKRFGNEWFGFNASFEHVFFYSSNVLVKMMLKEEFYLSYIESSKFLGSRRSINTLKQYVERLKTILLFIKEMGVIRTIEGLVTRTKGYYRHGLGHSLLLVFENRKTSGQE